ncbi:MAG: peptidyl-prolyl cis-trans isomerase A (cyclophilin A) [Myxococcota bacterium]|jgi:peptidyl-prolyl cis-trans isomerase A (cyclophilin A)
MVAFLTHGIARTGFNAALVAIVGVVIAGCGAPRDPDLEKRARTAMAAYEASEAEAEAHKATVTGGIKIPQLRVFSGGDTARVLGAVSGTGPLRAEIQTSTGTILCTLDEKHSPIAVTNFVGLATGTLAWKDRSGRARNESYYAGLSFHRVLPGYIIQGGKRANAGSDGGPGWTIAREAGQPIHFNAPGALAFVESGTNAHAGQFFIAATTAPELAKTYGAFGSCTNLAVIARIAAAPMTAGEPERPQAPVEIKAVRVYR